MISVDQALEIVIEHSKALKPVGLAFEKAPGRILCEDVVSDMDLPPFARSAVDGFALRASDTASLPASLSVVGTIAAGCFPRIHVGPGQSARIMTGAPVPDGADAVQMVEQTRSDNGRVLILDSVQSGQNIAPRASEVREGDIVLKRGIRLDAATLAVLATVGRTKLQAGPRPRVAVIATGDELVHPSQQPEAGQIRNSNGFSLVAQARAAGAKVTYLGVAGDNLLSLKKLISEGMTHDVLLLSGGVSMGQFDLVEQVLSEFEFQLLIDSVALKPGKPMVFGTGKNGNLVFGLPGNPVSTMVTFELFVRPALRKLEGSATLRREILGATLAGPLRSRGPRRAYLPGWTWPSSSSQLQARPIPTRGSADIVAFSQANSLLILPEDRDLLDKGEPVGVHPLDRFLI